MKWTHLPIQFNITPVAHQELIFFLLLVFAPKQQDLCALNCMEKYLKMNQRISQRFQEFQILANENAMAMAQKAGAK